MGKEPDSAMTEPNIIIDYRWCFADELEGAAGDHLG